MKNKSRDDDIRNDFSRNSGPFSFAKGWDGIFSKNMRIKDEAKKKKNRTKALNPEQVLVSKC